MVPSSTWLRNLLAAAMLCAAALWTEVASAAATVPYEAELERARETMLARPDHALAHADRAAVLARAEQDRRARHIALATAQWLASEALLRMNQPDRARPLVHAALRNLEQIEEPLELRAQLLLSRGTIEMIDSAAAQALESYQQAYRIFDRLGNAREKARTLQIIASLYTEARDYSSAEKYYRQAAEAYAGDPSLSLSMHNNRANVLRHMGRPKIAIEEYRKALRFARELKSELLIARIYGNLARAQIDAGQLHDAEQSIQHGLVLARSGDAAAWRPPLLAIAADVARGLGQLRRAEKLIDRSLEGVNPATTSTSYRDAHYSAYVIYRDVGRVRDALLHLEALRRLNDEATKVAISTNTALMAARFDYANQELQIARLKAEELRRNVEFERARRKLQRIIFIGLGVAAAILVGVLSFGLVTVRRSRNEVRAANAGLSATNAALEKALKAKTEFLATTSHEIRTPLNGILGMTQVMLADDGLGPEARDRIGIVHGAGLTMRALVDDILDLAKMETGNLTVEQAPMDLRAALEDVSGLWSEQARAKGVAFSLDISRAPRWIEGDAARLRQIVYNLLSNALKFTASGEVAVRAGAVEGTSEPRFFISVRDTGIGIPADKQAEIFESFRQVDASTTRRFGGTGLGLAICRNLARALGGDIAVSSTPGEGATFTVTLPLIEAAPPGLAAAAGHAARIPLLVLDRNPISRSMLRTLLSAEFGEVAAAADLAEAVARLEAGGVAHVLVDRSALAAGWDPALQDLAALADAALRNRAVVSVLWTSPSEEDRVRLMSTGITQVIAKPIVGAALVERLARTNDGTATDALLVPEAA